MKVVVTGAGGMLGRDVVVAGRGMGHEMVGLTHDDLDITDPGKVERRIGQEGPGAVINCAAWTNVDAAESSEEEASRVNGEGAGFVADAAAKAGAPVVYVSTDYVFDGTKRGPYTESDEPAPVNAYGRSKLAGERATAQVTKNSFIVRTAWLFGPHRENFVETMLRLGQGGGPVVVTHDQIGSPTYTGHLAVGLLRLIDGAAYGIHHMAGEGAVSRYDYAMEIFRQSEVITRVMATTTDMMADTAQRPLQTALSSGRESPIRLPPWQRGLSEYLTRREQPQPEQPARKRSSATKRQPVLERRPPPEEEEAERADSEETEPEEEQPDVEGERPGPEEAED